MRTDSSSTVSIAWCRSLFRHKGKAALFFLTVMSVVVVGTHFAPRLYQSEAALYLRLGRENSALDATSSVGQGSVFAMPASRERELNSILEILRSRGMAEAVVDAVGAEALLSDATGQVAPEIAAEPMSATDENSNRDQAVRRLIGRIEIAPAEEANVIWITYQARSPEFAQRITGQYIDLYLERHVRFHRSSGTREFLASQTTDMKKRLEQAEEALRLTQQETQIIGLTEQRQALVNQIARLEADLRDSETGSQTLAAQLEALQRRLANVPVAHVTSRTKGMPNNAADQMREQLFALQIKEQELLVKFTSEHPELQAIREQIKQSTGIMQAESALRTQETEAVNRVQEEGQIRLLELEPLFNSTTVKRDALRGQLATAREGLNKLSDDGLRIARCQREVDLADDNYRKYCVSLDQARLDEALEVERISSVNVVQPPTLEPKPVSPNLALNMAIGLILAMGGAVALAVMADHFNPRLRTPGDIEQALNIPVVATIPHLGRPRTSVNGGAPTAQPNGLRRE